MPVDVEPLPITVDDIDGAVETVPPTPQDIVPSNKNYTDQLARLGEENVVLKERLEKSESKNKTVQILDNLIQPFAYATFFFMCLYTLGVGTFMFLNSTGYFITPLPVSVMEFMVGSTAATVLGLVGMVLTGIFVGARK